MSGPDASAPDGGARPSPNLWQHPATYEIENDAFDRAGILLATMRAIADWSGRTVLDIGCGSGYHLPAFATDARAVVGVEPHDGLRALAARRVRLLPGVQVRPGTAQALPLADSSIEVAHARWAYFFGPGCEPGLDELSRVLSPGGTAFVVDNDPTRSLFGDWFRRGFPDVDPAAVVDFWTGQGWQREQLALSWRFESRADLEAVVRIELPPAAAESALAEHDGLEVDYAVNLWWRRY